MKKKMYSHACKMRASSAETRCFTGKKVSPLHKGVSNKALAEIYNKYYRDQVSALYRAVRNSG